MVLQILGRLQSIGLCLVCFRLEVGAEVMSTLGVFLLLFLASLLIGNFALRFFRCAFHDRNEELVFSYGVGIIFLSWMVLATGITGHLTARALWIGVGFLGAIGSFQIPHLFRLFRNVEGCDRDEPGSRRLRIVLWLVIAIIGLRALVPVYDSDALVYHLSFPKSFLNLKRIAAVPDDVNAHFPFFTEMLYTLGLALKNEMVAQLFHWSLGVLLTFSLVSFFSRFFGSRKWGRIAALFFLLTPGVFNEMSRALVDIAWATYGFLSFYALVVGIPKKQTGWLFLSAIFLGAACGIKYLAALSVISSLGVFVFLAVRSGWKFRSILGWAAVAGVGIILVSGYWYFKAYRAYGNPVFPYFNPLFGLEPVIVHLKTVGEYAADRVGMERSLKNFIWFPFKLTFFPAGFDGLAEQIGPAYLIFSPFAFWGGRTGLRLAMGLYAVLFTIGWFWLAQATRFLYPVLPFLVLLIMSGLYFFHQSQKLKSAFYTRMLFLVLLLNGSLLIFHAREGFSYLAGLESKDVFLEKRERSYGVAKFINESLPLDAKILNFEEHRMFYFNRDMVREGFYSFRTKYDRTNRMDEILRNLKGDGFTHILVVKKMGGKTGDEVSPWIDLDSKDEQLERVYQSRFRERDGRERKYTLFRIR